MIPLDGMQVHCRVTPSIFAGTHLYTWVKRSTVRVKCLALEHNTMTPARAQTSKTTRSRVERTNHEATAPPLMTCEQKFIIDLLNSKHAFIISLTNKFHIVMH